jgi:pilus assembly protein CpaF
VSLETILPFLQPIARFISDPEISELMVNGDGSVFIQRNGKLEPVSAKVEQRYLSTAVKRIARSLGEDISESKPLLDARLPDGSRVAAAFPPCSIKGITLTIRKFRPQWFTLDELVTLGSVPRGIADQLAEAVLNRQTILVSGGTDTGKTTFTSALE